MEEAESPEELLSKQHRKEKKDLQGTKLIVLYFSTVLLINLSPGRQLILMSYFVSIAIEILSFAELRLFGLL